MPAPTLVDALNSYIDGDAIKWNGNEPTPAEFIIWAALWSRQYGPDGWPIGAADAQIAVDAASARWNKLWNEHYPQPEPVPSGVSPLGFDFHDGSYLPTNESAKDAKVGDRTVWEGKTYVYRDYFSGISDVPRWVLQP